MTDEFNPKNIVVRMPNWLGDAVMATPILADLRKKWKEANITAMALSPVAQLIRYDPHIDEIFSFHKPSGWIRRQSLRDIIRPLIHKNYDLGILLTNSFSSAWWFFRGKVQTRIGFAGNLRDFLLNIRVSLPEEELHQVVVYKKLLVPLGIAVSDTLPELYVTEEEDQECVQFLKDLGIETQNKLIGINPGASFGSAKCWLPERFKELSKKLLEDPSVKIVFFGDSSQAELIRHITGDLGPNVYDLAGKTTIRELMSLIKQCKLLLTNDSGPMHIADALGVPLIALFGSTSDVKTGPYRGRGGLVIHKHVSCSPCFLRKCPIDFRCMTEISVSEVYSQILSLLGLSHLSPK